MGYAAGMNRSLKQAQPRSTVTADCPLPYVSAKAHKGNRPWPLHQAAPALILLALALTWLRPVLPQAAGIRGIHYEHRATAAPHSIHILEVDPRLARIDAVRALDDGVGRETVSSMAQRRGASAAVNAGFFRMGGRYDGEPDGILKIGRQWFSDPSQARGAVGWSRGGETARIGRLTMKWTLRNRGATYRIDGRVVSHDEFEREFLRAQKEKNQ